MAAVTTRAAEFVCLEQKLERNLVQKGTSTESVSCRSQELYDFICGGPLIRSCCLDAQNIKDNLSLWKLLGDRVAVNLGFSDLTTMTNTQMVRIYHYYLPVFMWLLGQLESHKARYPPGGCPALVVGFSAPQGCGKSTLCEQLEDLFHFTNYTAASVSIDDFYLTYKEQQALAAANPDNKLLQYRGNAGSHDLALGTKTLSALTVVQNDRLPMSVPLPRYNKSAHSGRGDRAEAEHWPVVQGPMDVVLFEGWMLGFRPLAEAEVQAISPDLVAVNAALRAYSAAWDRFVNCWVVIRVEDPQHVYRWRLQAEVKMRESGKAAMTDEQVADFVDRYMPAYRAYLPGLYTKGPTTCEAGRVLVVGVDENRIPLKQQS